MTNFDDALAFVLANEGGYVDNPNDTGAATNKGISLRFLRQIPSDRLRKYGVFNVPETLFANDVKDLTDDQIKLIYKGEFWDNVPFQKISNQKICNYLFDSVVNHGISAGIKLFQRAFWAYCQQQNIIPDDGQWGLHTEHAIEVCDNPNILMTALMAERAGYMRLIAATNSKDKEFLNGWLKRAYRS